MLSPNFMTIDQSYFNGGSIDKLQNLDLQSLDKEQLNRVFRYTVLTQIKVLNEKLIKLSDELTEHCKKIQNSKVFDLLDEIKDIRNRLKELEDRLIKVDPKDLKQELDDLEKWKQEREILLNTEVVKTIKSKIEEFSLFRVQILAILAFVLGVLNIVVTVWKAF